MITTGVVGQAWRGSVTESGSVVPWDGGPTLGWYVAAEDRWHVPEDEASVRQVRISGTAVTETRVRVPNGDVVQRIYSTADSGGITVVEIENESTRPVAVAFDHRDVLTERPIPDTPVEGLDLPQGAFVMPLAHTATVRVGLPHTSSAAALGGRMPTGVPSVEQVVRGWLTVTERASRLVLPDQGLPLVERCVAERCELVLGVVPEAREEPASFAVALGQLVRMGERSDPWLPELVEAVEQLGSTGRWEAATGLAAAGGVLAAAGERRALRDLDRVLDGRRPVPRPAEAPAGALFVAWVEQMLADGPALLAHGVPPTWFGQSLEVYGVPTGRTSSVSFAIRWHGARPAVLWEQHGEPLELSAPVFAPSWSTRDASGEALWPEPAARRGDPVTP